MRLFRLPLLFLGCLVFSSSAFAQGSDKKNTPPSLGRQQSSRRVYARVLQLEDQRNYAADEMNRYLFSGHAGIRRRVALAIGRIGDPEGVNPLVGLLFDDGNATVRAMAAFGLGEIEHPRALEPLLEVLKSAREQPLVRARAAEAIGKIVAANTATAEKTLIAEANRELISVLPGGTTPVKAGSGEELLATLTETALLRTRSAGSVAPLAVLLGSPNEAIRWHAANALARLVPAVAESPEARAAVPALVSALKDENALVRSGAARALIPLRADAALEGLARLLADPDERVRVGAVRALGRLTDPKALTAVLAAATPVLAEFERAKNPVHFDRLPFLLEVATACGEFQTPASGEFLRRMRRAAGVTGQLVEVETALAKVDAKGFLDVPAAVAPAATDWQAVAGFAAGLGECSSAEAVPILLAILDGKRFGPPDARSVPSVLRALAKRKADRLPDILRGQLKAADVIVRATAAELLGSTPPTEETFAALSGALTVAGPDVMNDAKLAILAAIARYDRPQTAKVLSAALRDPDYLVRRQAADLLNRVAPSDGEDQSRIGIIRTDRDAAFYRRIVNRWKEGRNPVATIQTEKGEIRIEFFEEDAPLTVESFLSLAEKGFFNGLTFHRVVPNFVIQGGDPRGDGDGGPGYQIRCEINQREYDRGSVGMALSGKDTGGSQFFICHSPQPHLDGGYTVFGKVVSGMDVVDRIVRTDRIEKIVVQR